MTTDTHISGLDSSAWMLQARTLGYSQHGWIFTMASGNFKFTHTFFCIMDDFGFLVEVPAPWQR